jgi:hypothetical protein
MAIRACVLVIAIAPSALDNTRIDVQVQAIILGSQLGSYLSAEQSILVESLDPPSMAVLNNSIASTVKDVLSANGVPFDVTDTVLVY